MENNVTKLKWPPQSPDLNVIEHIWEYLNRNIPLDKRTTVPALFHLLEDYWQKIDKQYISKLIESIPRRLHAVIKAKGGPTKY